MFGFHEIAYPRKKSNDYYILDVKTFKGHIFWLKIRRPARMKFTSSEERGGPKPKDGNYPRQGYLWNQLKLDLTPS